MSGDDAFRVEGLVVEVLTNSTYRVALPNGHRLLAFVRGKRKLSFGPLAPGNKVWLRLAPHDLSVGRILADEVWGRE